MPELESQTAAGLQTDKPSRFAEIMKSLADTVKANPELITTPAGAIIGSGIGSAVAPDNRIGGALVGAGAGGGMAYALTELMKGKSPGDVPSDPDPQRHRSLGQWVIDNPVKTGIGSIPALGSGFYASRRLTDVGNPAGFFHPETVLPAELKLNGIEDPVDFFKKLFFGDRRVFGPVENMTVTGVKKASVPIAKGAKKIYTPAAAGFMKLFRKIRP